MSAKVSIIGAGMTGATTAHWLSEREIADIVLVDVIEGLPQGKALDLQEAMPVIGKDVKITGSNDYEATEKSDIVVITAGLPRKPGMSREDLLAANADIVRNATEETVKRSPNAIFIVLTNPLDTMAYLTMKIGKLAPERVIGQAGILDSTRMRAFVSMELGVSVENIQCYVLGGHGDEMVPLTRHSNVAGVPLTKILPAERLTAIVDRTRKGGEEIVRFLKTGSAYYAPSAALAEMVDAIALDQKRVLPCSTLLEGEYGIRGLCVGVPVKLGAGGVEEVVSLDLTDGELTALHKSASAVRESMAVMKL